MTKTLDEIEQYIAGIPAGKTWGVKDRVRGGVFFARRAAGLTLVASWPVMEGHDDDFGSSSCGCNLSGRPHECVEKVYGTPREAAEAYIAAEAAWLARRPVRL